MAERTVTIGEAAGILGVSTEALRKRIKRGTIKAQKNGGGQWLVVLDGAEAQESTNDGSNGGVQTANGGVHDVTTDILKPSGPVEDALRDEVTFLRDEISFLRQEVARLDTIIITLTQNVKLLEAPKQEQQSISWWSRLKRIFTRKG